MAGVPEPLRQALAERYKLVRELGHGGNATVYLAHDVKHRRQVAIKVLAPELALAVRTERFMREIEIAARLTHPNILPLYDSGAARGFLYYVMPYVEGESLRERLRREKQLPLAEALGITREVVEALRHAHSRNVVHRDIKPENILFVGSHAIVADFGIARALVAAGEQTVTETGIAVGTPAYMSPEQAGGQGDVDARSDVYSLGCVVYEMLVGHPPYTGSTAQEIIARHTLDPVPTVRAARAAVPVEVERAVMKALAKQPADRFATVAEFVAALSASSAGSRSRWRAPVYAGLALAFLLGASALAARVLRNSSPVEQSVAVLPFVNLSGDSTNEYFSDGITEELINALVRIPGLRVPARTSSFFFKGQNLSVREIGDSLNVATVLEGSLRKAGNRLRITAQLINVRDGYHLWSETYDHELDGVHDLITVQDEIARAIASGLRINLTTRGEAPLVVRATRNPVAYELYLRGRYFWYQRTEDGIHKAIEYFTRAVALDSGYAIAYSGLSDAYSELGARGYVPGREVYPQAEASALRALALDDSLAEAHAALGKIRAVYHWDLSGAERELQRAIALNPRYAFAHSWYALWVLQASGRHDEAIREARLGAELEPLVPATHGMLGNVLYHARRYDEAIEQFGRSVEMSPDVRTNYSWLGRIYAAQGRFEEALTQFQLALGPDRPGPGHLSRVGYVYARSGKRAEALGIVAELRAMPGTSDDPSLAVATVYAGLGDNAQALDALETAFIKGPRGPPWWPLEPVWDGVRAETRFVQLVKRLRLGRSE